MTQPSPIELTPEQRQEYDKRRSEDFKRDYDELTKKHGLELAPILITSPQGIIPTLALTQIKDDTQN